MTEEKKAPDVEALISADFSEYEARVLADEKNRDLSSYPLGDGTFLMCPSGDMVDLTERNRRLKRVS